MKGGAAAVAPLLLVLCDQAGILLCAPGLLPQADSHLTGKLTHPAAVHPTVLLSVSLLSTPCQYCCS